MATPAALATHRWGKHRVRAEVRSYVATTDCPACKKPYFTRIHVIHHLERAAKCREHVLTNCPKLDDQLYKQLEEEAAAHLRSCRKSGTSPYALPI